MPAKLVYYRQGQPHEMLDMHQLRLELGQDLAKSFQDVRIAKGGQETPARRNLTRPGRPDMHIILVMAKAQT
jgi:hypothetical protein